MKSLQNEQNSTNLLLWSSICRNKSAITPKWFNSLDTNSMLCTYFMNSLSCEESPKITGLNNRNKISFLVLAERIDMIFRAPFDDFLVWTSGFFGIFKSCCQKYSRLRCFLLAKGLVICFYLGWSGSILQFRQNIKKVGSKSWLLIAAVI